MCLTFSPPSLPQLPERCNRTDRFLFHHPHRRTMPMRQKPPVGLSTLPRLRYGKRMKSRLEKEYEALAQCSGLVPDPAQRAALVRLAALGEAILAHRPRKGIIGRLRQPSLPALRGLYLWGAVGRGKSMVMDLFCNALPEAKKRRLHFHEFMREVHDRLGEFRKKGTADALAPVAREIARKARLLCLDEMEVKDIADAMVLARLFEVLAREGVFIVTTSNRPPEDLYKNGLNRALFEPFIAYLRQNFDVVELAGEEDYRKMWHSGAKAWLVPDDAEAGRKLDGLWDLLTGTATPAPLEIAHAGRKIGLAAWANGIGRSDFDALCRTPLGPGDYLALAEHLRFLILDHVPRLGPDDGAAARRFINLVDVLHDRGIRLAASAAAEPEALLDRGNSEAFEFDRTVSRIRVLEGPDDTLIAARPRAGGAMRGEAIPAGS